ncbi:MAG: integral rane sensor signal transduction histidine kinase [Alphaproteobacteria bacterium]|nr:integral rane sensor signal transduction histidine kinase [Alphaproteobacteria bacterium]
MKQRLLWKILVGFWITFFLMSQGIWLLFTLLRPVPEHTRAMARVSVSLAAAAIASGGDRAFEAERAKWPEETRRQLVAAPALQPQSAEGTLATQLVKAPDGVAYRISYRVPPESGRGFFAIPKEILIVALVGGLLFSTILAWYLTRPISRMRDGFGRLAQGDFKLRLGPAMGRRRDEIADLAHHFDSMAIRLEELVAARDRLLADVSHELRTPLSRLNLAIGLARQDPAKLAVSLDRITLEAEKLDEMVGELLTLAKLESGHIRSDSYFSFLEVIKAVIKDACYEAAAKGITVSLAIEPEDEALEWLVRGDGKLMNRAVENIVRNALRYSPEGAEVTVTLQMRPGQFHLTVTDEGPGIADIAISSLFKPFGISADGFGFGLGLAIAQRAIAVNGGTITVRNRDQRGLEVAVMLPAAGTTGA